MNRYRYSLLALTALAGALTLSGCGAGSVNAVTGSPSTVSSPVTPQVSTGLHGVNMGGHAPLVGAHIYLVQLGAPSATVTQTYGSVVKNLLTMDGSAATTGVYSGTPSVLYKYGRTQNGSWPTATSGGYASDQFVPSTDLVGLPFYGVTTNQYGEFNLTGDYACNAGYPVMLIGYGGAPSYYGAGPNSVALKAVSLYIGTVSGVQGVANGTSGGIFTYYLASGSTELFYTGESVTTTQSFYPGYNTASGSTYGGTGVTGPTTGVLSGGEVTFTSTGVPAGTATLTATQYSVFVPGYSGGGTGYYTFTTGTGTATPAFNPAAVNMAMAGLCPSSGNFSTPGNGALNYIYMNEVSTTAAAYALAQFVNTAATNQTGNDEFHIGAPVANLAGLQASAVTAGLLYDIQGSSSGSTTFDGENHTARSTTPCPASGGCASGTVPNSQINTIANSLAACVDSSNSYRIDKSTGTQSTACQTLFKYSQDNGFYDTSVTTHNAVNIAQAALNLARFPEGLGTATTSSGVQTTTAGTSTTASNFVSAIYNLPAGSNVPFAPSLSAAPNDFAVAIQWSPGTSTTDVAIDASGNAWAESGYVGVGSGNLTPTTMYEFTPSTAVGGGMYLTSYSAAGGLSQALTSGPAVDSTGAVWAPGLAGMYKFTPVTPPVAGTAGVQVGSGNSVSGGRVFVDSSFNQYIPSGSDGNSASSIVKQNSAGTSAGGNYPIAPTTTACAQSVGYFTLDTSSNLWTITSQNYFAANQYICRFSNAGALQFSFYVPNGQTGQAGTGGGYAFPRGLVTDRNDNAWFLDKDLDSLYQVLAATPNNNYSKRTIVPGQLSAPKGLALDGANTLWAASTGDTGATTGAKYGTGLVQFSDTDTVITPNYITGASAASSSTSNTSLGSVAIDQSGNVWAAQGSQTTGTVAASLVYEYIGLATPTTNPISVAKANGTVAAKPGLTSTTVSGYSYTSGNGTQAYAATIATANAFTVGEVVLISGFQTSTTYNGHLLMITAYVNANNIRGYFIDGFAPANTSSPVGEAGALSAVN